MALRLRDLNGNDMRLDAEKLLLVATQKPVFDEAEDGKNKLRIRGAVELAIPAIRCRDLVANPNSAAPTCNIESIVNDFRTKLKSFVSLRIAGDALITQCL